MGQVSAVLRKVDGGYAHWCPGCREAHAIHTERPNHCNARWNFDGNVARPTFSPSINIFARDPEGEIPDERCHYFLKGGMLEFLGDCTHALAGQTVPLPELPPHLRDH